MSSHNEEHGSSKLQTFLEAALQLQTLDFIILAILSIYAFHNPTNSNFYFFCTLFTFICLIFWIMSFAHLGNSLSHKSKTVGFVKDGIYSKIRHPMYFFSTLGFFFVAVYINSLAGYMLLVILIIIQFERSNREDKVLEQRFGGEFINYKENTWF